MNYCEAFDFPDVNLADEDGLLAIGGDLSSGRLLCAYQKGIFPWFNADEPIAWYSPDPRMIITPDTLRVSQTLKKQTHNFSVKVNQNFSAVIEACAKVKRHNQSGTWIHQEMVDAYTKLYERGFAHSIETYKNDKLVGGLYGVALGKVFFGESMFFYENNASKVAFVYLLQNMDFELIDCQIESEHLKSLGAFNVSRETFLTKLINLL
jgi:leucyl/phenylalanyl-tRNA--protein transferase